MDLRLSPEEAAFRKEVRDFILRSCPEELRRGQVLTTSVYPEPEISRPWHRILAEKGWLAPLWPREYGGTGWTPQQCFIFEAEAARLGAPLVYPMSVRLVAPVIIRFGTEAQKQYYLPRILSGEDYWCQGYSEPGAGSDLASLQCRAVRDGDAYVINGSKIWTTHAHHANKMFLLVRTAMTERPQEGISFLLADLDVPGVTIRPIRTISGEHEVNEVFFDNVRIPVENLLGEENGGWECAKYLLAFERGRGLFSGRMRSTLNRVRSAIAELDRQGAGIFEDRVARRRFADVAMRLDAFEMLELRSLQQAAETSAASTPSILKLKASRLKQDIARLGIDLAGVHALGWNENGAPDDEACPFVAAIANEYLNSRAVTIFGGSAEIQLGIIARAELGA